MFNTKIIEDVIAFNSKYQEALVASAEAAKAGVEEFNKVSTKLTNAAFKQAADASKQASALKTPQDIFTAQTTFATKAFDTAVADSKTLMDLSVKVATDASQPLADHAKEAWETAAKAA